MVMENTSLDFSGGVEDSYNAFSMDELSSAINLSKNTSRTCRDPNAMLQHLPESDTKFLLDLFNCNWREHTIAGNHYHPYTSLYTYL